MISHLIASFEGVSVIGHGYASLLSIAKWHYLLKCLLLVHDSDRQAPLDLLNLLQEEQMSDPGRWQTHHINTSIHM
jgi:hypothetical protein